MPVAPSGGSNNNGMALLIGAGFVFEVIAAYCSSPQTAEINADKRAETLMKWVKIGEAQSILFITVAALVDKKHALPIIFGGVMAGGIMYYYYAHAMKCGLASRATGTED